MDGEEQLFIRQVGGLAVLAVILLFAFPRFAETVELRIKDTQATLGAAHDWGEFEVFRTAVDSNLTVSSALDAGLIQRVNGTSVEQNGFVLTVDGIAADQKGIIVLYTLQNNTMDNSQKFRVSMINEKNEWVGLNLTGIVQNIKRGITRGYEQILWDNEYTKMPEQLLVNARISNDLYANSEQAAANLSVPIPLHKESLAKTGDTLQINKSLTIAGQSYDINMILDERFTDGKGGAHTINYDDFNLYSHIVDITQENSPTQYYINLGSEALPQPLTFKINSYPNPIKENVSLFIRK